MSDSGVPRTKATTHTCALILPNEAKVSASLSIVRGIFLEDIVRLLK